MLKNTPSFPIDAKEELIDKLEILDKEKSRKLTKMFYYGILIAFSGPIVALFVLKVNSLEAYIPVVTIFGGISLVIYIISRVYKSNVIKRFKTEAIANLLRYLLPNVQYHPQNAHIISDFNRMKLFKKGASKLTGEDYFEGVRGGVKFKISEVKTNYRSNLRYSKSILLPKEVYDNRVHLPLFNGLVIICEKINNIKKPIKIYSKECSNYFFDKELKKIETQNENFNNKYDLYSYLKKDLANTINDDFLNQLLHIKEVFNAEVNLSILPNSVNVAIKTSTNFFDPQVGKKIDLKQVERIYQEIVNCLMVVDIIDELNVNNIKEKSIKIENVKKITS
jgi:hypothetical protein